MILTDTERHDGGWELVLLDLHTEKSATLVIRYLPRVEETRV